MDAIDGHCLCKERGNEDAQNSLPHAPFLANKYRLKLFPFFWFEVNEIHGYSRDEAGVFVCSHLHILRALFKLPPLMPQAMLC